MENLKPLYKFMVETAYRTGNPFLPSCCSALPIINKLYADFIVDDGRFILSKGHANLALQTVRLFFGWEKDPEVVNRFMCDEPTHTGSLGHGLPFAIGCALERTELGEIHVLMGDGEIQEGTTWESLCIISRLELQSRIVIHIDRNGGQGSGPAPQWPVNIIDSICGSEGIKCIIYNIRKGSGIKYLADKPLMHTFRMTAEQYNEILGQFDHE
jgi:transketolase N-terminal domain/subunit